MSSNKRTYKSLDKAVDILFEVLDQGHEVFSQRELQNIIDDLSDIIVHNQLKKIDCERLSNIYGL